MGLPMYDPRIVQPMRDELTSVGVKELRTAEEVDSVLGGSSGTVLVVVNSVCGCSAGAARPGIALALRNAKLPQTVTTVFAGQDQEATERARSYFVGFPPSSPSVALLKDGKVVHMVHRADIQGHSAQQVADQLTAAFDKFC